MPNRFERKETYSINEVLDFIPNPKDYPKDFKLKKIKRDYDGDPIKMGSQRYYVFKESVCCAFCNIEGKFFAKERHLNKKGQPCSESFHMNLYAIDENGNDVLMTKDHIIPRAKGGRDVLSNYQNSCFLCNELKSAMDDDKFRDLLEGIKNKDPVAIDEYNKLVPRSRLKNQE